MPRLRRVSIEGPGWRRRRSGRGFVYLASDGARLVDEDVLARIRALAIPPAWTDVWICPHANGHIQAAGLDDAGRRQYLYHVQWRARRDRAKHDHVLDVARRLPRARRRAAADLAQDGWPRTKSLALAFRLLDLAYFRAGNETYARTNGSYGLATLRREHVRVRGGAGSPVAVHFTYPAKSGQVRDVLVEDEEVAQLVATLRRRRSPGVELLAWREGPVWRDITSADVTSYVKELLGEDASPKDFRTWHATVLAAQGLAAAGPPPSSDRARRRVVTAVVRDVADALGNTPAVCRASYIDPRLVELWEREERIPVTRSQSVAERAVLELLSGPSQAAAARAAAPAERSAPGRATSTTRPGATAKAS
ncbi:DNA topoisomerase IB [Cellulomonas fimi]|uniref:DNA topoisomerase n=1 Tax=Cellulomonas fimi TaxID=1708 RepID=A0A7Y0LXD4_CELFI|nr:DNA topoisomerase IB [Cellulomonas fimi]NMR19659.1 DNA topoisomerase IB [Cellulomonas fimi]